MVITLNQLRSELPEFLQFLKKNEKDCWIAPMLDVAEYIKALQTRK